MARMINRPILASKMVPCICNVTYNSNKNSLNLISLLLNNSHLVKENANEKLQFSGVSEWLNYLNLNDLWEIELSTLYMNDLNKIYNESFSSSAIIEIFQHSGQCSHLQPNRFELCKEKAFDFLQKSEQINSCLESMAF
ncbi:hypothetical protein BpHYR1_017317 [Brachionus plicatilis]|uniref:Uncharacterized protein n=1 Tax=Brachionus plicatilis TaxID=10195 RepID=A0A3M7QFK0_BRAPC|nr:hypothetical protein BpHYR1_017317 [Brachionus plicatilis]